MTRQRQALVVFSAIFLVVLLLGCLPIGSVSTEPLSDPEKAVPDKALLGRWKREEASPPLFKGDKPTKVKFYCEIDSPKVEGNPKGLMRLMYDDNPKQVVWFFTTKIGKHTYGTAFVPQEHDPTKLLEKANLFGGNGGFSKWKELRDQKKLPFEVQFVTALYAVDGDNLAVDYGDRSAIKSLLENDKDFMDLNEMNPPVPITPPGWLAKYLDKNGPEAIFNGKNTREWKRR